MEKRSYSPLVDYCEFKEIVTGHMAKHPTTIWNVDGTDIGLPFYSEKENSLFYIFGDTFSTPFPKDGKDWRGTVVGKTKLSTLKEKDWKFDSFILDEKGFAKDIIPSHHKRDEDNYEVTRIATGGIEINGVLYLLYESIRQWHHPGNWDVNFCGAIKSKDGGQTWERVHNITWVETDNGEHVNTIKTLAEEDYDMKPSGVSIDLSKRVCSAFSQVYLIPVNEYVYIYGRHSGRSEGLYVARCLKEKFEDFDSYEYLCGFNDDKPNWKVGYEGMQYINQHDDECTVLSKPVANISIIYNEYFKKWLAVYYKPGVNIVMQMSDSPYGPFSEKEILIGMDYPFPKGKYCYGANTHELMSLDNGQTLRILLSQWTDQIYGVELFEVRFK